MPRKSRSPTPDEPVYEVEKITNHKEVADKKGRINIEFCVRWKNYPPEDDTWEPRASLVEGAEGILDAYIAKKERKGNPVPEDGARRKSVATKVKEDRPPASTDSTKESKKRKKESIVPQDEEAVQEEERPKKKKEKAAPAPIDVSPDPEPVPTKVKKSKDDGTPQIKRASNKENGSSKKAVTDEPAEAASSKKVKKQVKEASPVEDDIIVDIEEKKGSVEYAGINKWDHLVTVESLEQDVGTYRWFISWGDNFPQEWVPNEVARKKFPQRLFDFYESHLKFRPPPVEEEEMEE